MQSLWKWIESLQFAQSQSQVVSTRVRRNFTDPVLCADLQLCAGRPKLCAGLLTPLRLCAGLLTPHWLCGCARVSALALTAGLPIPECRLRIGDRSGRTQWLGRRPATTEKKWHGRRPATTRKTRLCAGLPTPYIPQYAGHLAPQFRHGDRSPWNAIASHLTRPSTTSPTALWNGCQSSPQKRRFASLRTVSTTVIKRKA